MAIGSGVVTPEGGQSSEYCALPANPPVRNNIILCNGARAHSETYSGTLRTESNNFFNCSGTPSQTNAIVGDPMFVNTASDRNLQAASPERDRRSQTLFACYDGVAIVASCDSNGVVRPDSRDFGIYNY